MICQSSKRNWSYSVSCKEALRRLPSSESVFSHPKHSDSRMTYDWLNRQTSWSDGKNTEKQVYRGAEWKRIATITEKADGSKDTVKYLYDGDNVIVDYSAENKVIAQYVTPELDQYISMTRDGKTAYYTQDGLGSVRTLTDASGNGLNQSDYFAFGEWNAGLSKGSVVNRYGYTGREKTLDEGQMYYRWRMYEEGVGRFLLRDSDDAIRTSHGDLYVYGNNNPIIYIDSDGKVAVIPIILVAWSTYTIGKGVSNLILASVYTKYCLQCQRRAKATADSMAESIHDPYALSEWLKHAQPGFECSELCSKAGIHAMKGLTWLFCGVVVRYGVSYP